jgi:2-oxoglutarate dehydrogenase E2 component (dihydrolipoamide succinyltransferase)
MSAEATVVVAMPHMGVSVEEGTVIEWLVAEGEEVEADQVLCAIATDKVDAEVPAPAAGVVARIVAAEGASVPVGEPLAELRVSEGVSLADVGAPGEGSADATRRDEDAAGASKGVGASRGVSAEPSPAARSGTERSGPPARQSLVADSATKLGHDTDARSQFRPHSGRKYDRDAVAERAAAGRDRFGRFDPRRAAEAVLSFVPGPRDGSSEAPRVAVPASPVARRMAAARGIDLGSVQGSGRRGRIRKADVEKAGVESLSDRERKSTPPAAGADDLPPGYAGIPHEVVESSRVRLAIAEHMARSRRTAAHMTTEVDIDLAAVVRARAELNEARRAAGEPKLSYLPLIARAACVALAEHPQLNATFLGERSIRWQAVNLGVAVDTPQGLLVPVVRDCQTLTAPAIGAAIADLAERARTRRLTPDDLAGGTFTLSNPGSVGAVSAPAIINQPQVAILGIPTIQRRPWVVTDPHGEESIAIRPILRLAVTFDHRALDGADATRFAVTLKDLLESWSTAAYT